MNRVGCSNNKSDNYLTPPELIRCLGPFHLDPCVPNKMPWRTARYMVTERQDGLGAEWKGRVWLNPPYSDVLPWARRFVEHRNGIALVSGRGPETKWGQLLLSQADLVLFLDDRLRFYRKNGEITPGKWWASVLVAIGKVNVEALKRAAFTDFRGVLMRPV